MPVPRGLRVRFIDYPGRSPGWALERLADGTYYDFPTKVWKAPVKGQNPPVVAMAEITPGNYGAFLDASTDLLGDGNFRAVIFSAVTGGVPIDHAAAQVVGGDDCVIPFMKLPTTARITFDPPAGTAIGGH